MADRCDIRKRQAWEARLNRFRLSELTVAKFCDQERVSVHAFYYWSRRIRSLSAADTDKGAAADPSTGGGLREPHDVSAEDTSSPRGLVWFRWNGTVEVAVPADCLDTIRCLTKCLDEAQRECATAFQQVVVTG